MTTSGTVGQTSISVIQVMEHAARRCGLLAAQLTPEHLEAMRNNLYLYLSELANRGVSLWAIDRIMLGLYENQVEYVLPTGTVDVLNAYLRTPSRSDATAVSSAGGTASYLTDGDPDTVCTQISTNGNFSFDLTDDTAVTVVGILPGTTGSFTLLIEGSADDVTWATLRVVGAATYTDRIWSWLAVEPSRAFRYVRVRETAGGTLVFRELVIAASAQDIQIARINRDDYLSLPSKTSAGDPRQYWLDRQLTPSMILWPVPSNTFACLSLATHRHIEDVGAFTNTLELPQRWMDPVIWNLAWRTAMELPEAKLDRIELLGKYAVQSQIDAEAEERDASPIYLSPRIGVYTR